MLKRGFDIFVSAVVLVAVSPLLLLAAVGIAITSPGPLFYHAQRGGRGGEPFSMFKFRSMHVGADKASAITAPSDRRIFPFGAFIRKVKIDELPQFLNILRGDMSIVGPRPEDTRIIEDHYTPWMRETLDVRPGITSPGAIFGYLHGDTYLDPDDPEGSYIRHQMPAKLAIERAYLNRMTFLRDLGIVFSTVGAIIRSILGIERPLPEATRRDMRRWHDAEPPR